MRLHQFTQFTNETAPIAEAKDDEIDAMGADLLRSLYSIAGRLEQFVKLLDQEQSADLQSRPNER